ncbi:RING-type domain-containing protein [Plasmodiophora brassicae]|uniref:RING-type domain-containing protein n=2 Tax=Plasmodiophora brassicae TaxID=37360 RepID=A0A3P3YIM0_PLABS|nr:unnamed protein product [Plasmodiophora brassicae]
MDAYKPGELSLLLDPTSEPVVCDTTCAEVMPKQEASSSDQKRKLAVTTTVDRAPKKARTHDHDDRNERTVFIGNVDVSSTAQTIRKLLGCKVESVRFRSAAFSDPKLPKRAAFITKQFHDSRPTMNCYAVLSDVASVERCLALNGTKVDGHTIRVDRVGSYSLQHDDKRCVFVGNLPFDIAEDELFDLFSVCGPIEFVRCIRDRASNVGKGFAFVQMKVAKDVKPALAFHETTFRNRALRVFRASDQKAKSGAARRIAGKIKPGKQSLKKAQRSAPGPRLQLPSPRYVCASLQLQLSSPRYVCAPLQLQLSLGSDAREQRAVRVIGVRGVMESVMVPAGAAGRYVGLLNVAGAGPFPIEVDMGGGRLQCDPRLAGVLSSHVGVVRQRLASARGDIAAFMTDLQDIVARVMMCAPEKHAVATAPTIGYYERVVRDIERVGWERIVDVDRSLLSLTIRIMDQASREHEFVVRLTPDYPATGPECVVDVPGDVEIPWSAQSSLLDVVQNVEKIIGQFDSFWSVLEDIDAHCWVIEPDHATRASRSRRIAIGQHCSILVDIEPESPFRVCDCRFLGAESVVNPLRERLNRDLDRWDTSRMPRVNLERILSISFPGKPAPGAQDEFQLECGICYSVSRDGVVADRVCEDARCGRPFHNQCLFEWLQSIPSSRQSFSTLFGACPYCSAPLSATA